MRFIGENRLAQAGVAILLFVTVIAVLGPLFFGGSPTDIDLNRCLRGPSFDNALGCDQLGRDILSRVIHGARISLLVGLIVTAASLVVGTALGMLAGYRGGVVDLLLSWLFDTALAIPGLLLAIGVIAVLGPSFINLIIALCIMGWVGYARLARGMTLRVKENDYISAAKASGISGFRVITTHILPNIAGPLLVQASIGTAGVIITEATLSFLGLGGEVDAPSWGAMLNDGMGYLLVAPHITLFPGAAIAVSVLALNFIGDGLRDRLDPKGNIERLPGNK